MIRFPIPHRSLLALLLSAALFATACSSREKSGKGFVFPGGDANRGQTAFLELGCT